MIPPEYLLENYIYPLPEEKIAKYPLPRRDASKLLVYKNGKISEKRFFELPDLLGENTLMVFNNSKVIPARLLLKTPTGASIEVFCLSPYAPANYLENLQATKETAWKTMIRNKRRWKQEKQILTLPGNKTVELILEKENIVRFRWDFPGTFGEILEEAGSVPIPPYLKREAEEQDKETYQTVYARTPGSVAAPTAGLHFTEKLRKKLQAKNIDFMETTLHVGAGTFKPVSTQDIREHIMHAEPVSVSRKNLEKLLQALRAKKDIIFVGTTSVRSVESLYFLALLLRKYGKNFDYTVPQNAPYTLSYDLTPTEALELLLEETSEKVLTFSTALFIYPGYSFLFADALITNFHQPSSSLLLLVASLIGEDWKKVYHYALEKDFRFLSYGDSSLLWKANS